MTRLAASAGTLGADEARKEDRTTVAPMRPGVRFGRLQIRMGMAFYIAALRATRWLKRGKRPIPPDGATILLTGTFHSDNWVRSHVKPLAASHGCARIVFVANAPVPTLPKVEGRYPPGWLVRTVGAVPARLLVFVSLAFRIRPHIIGAFHLLVNGLLATLLARIAGARSMYFCVGGPVEVLDGGIWGENRYFAKAKTPDPLVEAWLLEAVQETDIVVTMGTRAVRFFREHGVTTSINVIAGGIDTDTFHGGDERRRYDAVLVARLVPIKSIHLFLQAIASLTSVRPSFTAAIVGDGPLRAQLEAHARELGVAAGVTFAGHQVDVQRWLRESRVFVLTSQSEGLALSLMEAMMCGLPAIVPHVGDLADLVNDDVNGYLIEDRTPDAYASRLLHLLEEPSRWGAFSHAAQASAQRYTTASATARWDAVLQECGAALTPREMA